MEYGGGPTMAGIGNDQIVEFPVDDSDQPFESTDSDRLLDDPGSADNNSQTAKASPFSIAYYSSLFDVDTEDVVNRLKWAVTPRPGFTQDFARDQIRKKPDLYGPVWVATTLIFSVAIAGNVASYFAAAGNQIGAGEDEKHWHYDFHKVTLSGTLIFLYTTLLPAGIYFFLWTYHPKESQCRKPVYTELACIVGYSLTLYIPASLVWLVPISMVQWISAAVTFGLSGAVLGLALWPAITDTIDQRPKGIVIMAVSLLIHFLLALLFVMCFFYVPIGSGVSPATKLTTPSPNQSHIVSSRSAPVDQINDALKLKTVNKVVPPAVNVNAPVPAAVKGEENGKSMETNDKDEQSKDMGEKKQTKEDQTKASEKNIQQPPNAREPRA